MLLALLLGCAPEPLSFEYAGCVQSATGCELVPGEPLRVFVAAPPEAVSPGFAPDGRAPEGDPPAPRVEPAPGGARLVWEHPTTGTLTLRVQGAEGRLVLRDRPDRPWEAELRALSPAACRAEVDRRVPTLADATERATTLWVGAGCDLRAGERAAAVDRMEAAAQSFDAAGRPADAARARCALSSVLFGAEGSLPRVRAQLAALPEDTADGTVAWGVAWHRALLHRRTGNYRAAVEALDRADAVAERLGLAAERDSTREQRANLAAELGRFEEAIPALRQLVADTPVVGECGADTRAAARRTALAWLLLLQVRAEGLVARAGGAAAPEAEAGLARLGEAEQRLVEAAGVHTRCRHPARDLANVEVNRALGALLAARPAEARAHLRAAAAAQPGGDPLYNAWVAEIEGRLALLEGAPEVAEAAFSRALAHAHLRGAPEAEAQALDGRALAHLAAGRSEAALDDLAAAQEALWSGVASVPLDAGGAAFLTAREVVPLRRVSVLLGLGRVEEAFAVARAARSHLVRAGNLQARLEALDPAAQTRWDEAVGRYRALRAELDAASADAWALPLAELEARRQGSEASERAARRALDEAMAVLGGPPTALPPVAAGDLLLLWVPQEGGWVGFAATAAGVRAAPVGDDLLAPFQAELRAARRVVLLPWGGLRERDLHTLPLDGAPLLERVPVVWSLDLGPRPEAPAGRLLLVADPGGDLPGARAEAATVRAARPQAEALLGPSATVGAVRGALATAGSFHYAGHATFREGDVWQAGLPLADGVLRVGDVLALPRAPDAVVLSACESGRAEPGAVEGWGLAQAFVARGARVVVGTSRPVTDRASARMASELYPPGGAAPPAAADPGSVAEAVRRAQLALRAAGDADWSAFRVWVP